MSAIGAEAITLTAVGFYALVNSDVTTDSESSCYVLCATNLVCSNFEAAGVGGSRTIDSNIGEVLLPGCAKNGSLSIMEIEDTVIIPAINSDACILKVRAITIKINWTSWWDAGAGNGFWCCLSCVCLDFILCLIRFKADSVDYLDTDKGKDGFVH